MQNKNFQLTIGDVRVWRDHHASAKVFHIRNPTQHCLNHALFTIDIKVVLNGIKRRKLEQECRDVAIGALGPTKRIGPRRAQRIKAT